ncbi:MAG: hypothetical protein IPL71_10425 [Anaerolineales bacterium]|uniref:penicillin-binding transpeptidase domain-containing protein n=1 Tax=Candidatus Villigracilis proximus TaxID=3140683 RepID=UPI0031354638|nr:hypothetical protein [Anaerolineales bacterium]
MWWEHLIYGTPPPGLDVRLSLSLPLQSKADQLLGGHTGAIILMNAETGEILAMASHPTYDPNKLDDEGEALSQNESAPLVNRAAQGLYPIGTTMLPLMRAQYGEITPSEAELKAYYERLGLYQAPAHKHAGYIQRREQLHSRPASQSAANEYCCRIFK